MSGLDPVFPTFVEVIVHDLVDSCTQSADDALDLSHALGRTITAHFLGLRKWEAEDILPPPYSPGTFFVPLLF